MSPAFAVQNAIRTALAEDAALASLLGGPFVYDEVPAGEPPLYVVLGEAETRDWSVADAKAHEHFITLEVVTNERSRAAAQSIASRIKQVLDDAALLLSGHRLVNLRLVFWNVSRRSNRNCGASLRFRAATEPL